jgi:hypothetical protein
MKKTKPLIALALVLGMTGTVPARAQDPISKSGNAFLAGCSMVDKEESMTPEVAICVMYIVGLVDGIEGTLSTTNALKSATQTGKGDLKELGICLPRTFPPGNVSVSPKQLTRVALKYMREHPEQTHWRTNLLIIDAWLAASPCAAKK